MKQKQQLPSDRLAIIKKMREYEALGGEHFFCDVENDPPSRTLKPSDVDYLHRTWKFKINGFLCHRAETICKIVCKHKFDITVKGAKNLKNITGGAIFTSNHFSVTENLAVKLAGEKAPGHHRMYKLVREGNYFMPGIIGWLLKYCDTLPLSSSIGTMRLLDRAVKKILSNGGFILVYPEQAMWWYYQKPRPYRIGAFYYAAQNGVPVVPCFVTIHPKKPGYDMLPDNVKYTIHVLPPIYPDSNVKPRDDAKRMMSENARLCQKKYEEVYGIKLQYQSNSDYPVKISKNY